MKGGETEKYSRAPEPQQLQQTPSGTQLLCACSRRQLQLSFSLPVYYEGTTLSSIKQSWLMTSLIWWVQTLPFNIWHLLVFNHLFIWEKSLLWPVQTALLFNCVKGFLRLLVSVWEHWSALKHITWFPGLVLKGFWLSFQSSFAKKQFQGAVKTPRLLYSQFTAFANGLGIWACCLLLLISYIQAAVLEKEPVSAALLLHQKSSYREQRVPSQQTRLLIDSGFNNHLIYIPHARKNTVMRLD